jgi:hypothetical protein
MRIRPPVGIIVVALTLAGCIASKAPLFDAASTVTPVAAGRFEVQEENAGKWVKRDAGTLKLEGRVYQWKVDSEEGVQRFSLYDVGEGYFIAAAPQEQGKPLYYFLLERKDEGWFSYAPLCSDFIKVRLPAELRPTVEQNDCYFADRATLTRALIAYAKVMLPGARYVPLKK